MSNNALTKPANGIPLPPPLPAFPTNSSGRPMSLAEFLNPNSHFVRSTSVPPENHHQDESYEMELNDHRKLIYDLIPKPSRQLKNCNWHKLPRKTIYASARCVWREVNDKQDELNLNYSQLEELFVKTNKVIHRRSSVSAYGSIDSINTIGVGDDIRSYGRVCAISFISYFHSFINASFIFSS